MAMNIGRVSQVIGPAVDVEFEEGKQPPIYQALHITSEGFDVPAKIDVIVEVQAGCVLLHCSRQRVWCVGCRH
jgi:F-type H+-transporting ATPase subunit beta